MTDPALADLVERVGKLPEKNQAAIRQLLAVVVTRLEAITKRGKHRA